MKVFLLPRLLICTLWTLSIWLLCKWSLLEHPLSLLLCCHHSYRAFEVAEFGNRACSIT